MKVSELRGKINTFASGDHALMRLSQSLEKFDDMPLDDFFSFLASKRVQKTSAPRKARRAKPAAVAVSDLVERLRGLKTDPEAFDAEIDAIGTNRSFTKKKLQSLYSSVFDTKSNLPDKLTKPEMIARIKRQRRRDANFASA